MMLLPVGSTIVMTVVGVQLMKLANRIAQRRIAAGEFPDMRSLRSDGTKGVEAHSGRLPTLT